MDENGVRMYGLVSRGEARNTWHRGGTNGEGAGLEISALGRDLVVSARMTTRCCANGSAFALNTVELRTLH
jgi:hypothetical protein